MASTQPNGTSGAIDQLHEQFSEAIRRQAEQIEKLNQHLKFLQNGQQQLEEVAVHLIEPLEKMLASGDRAIPLLSSGIFSSVRKLAGATYAEQVFAFLVEEAARMGSRAAVFDVRGRAAWGASASGFEPELSGETLRALVIPLNQEGPFRQAFETTEAVETSAGSLARNRNVMARLGPSANARVLLIPIRSAGSVAAVFYAETGERRDSILIDSLRVLAEFAGAQIGRLMVMNGGISEVKASSGQDQSAIISEPPTVACENEIEAGKVEAASSPEISQVVVRKASSVGSTDLLSEQVQTSSPAPEPAALTDEYLISAKATDVGCLSEEELKIHRDAQRFSKLLVAEIELYNKREVEDGRRNKDLYQRLKKDIDRSRETYEKRFANTVANQVDYLHEELVRRLADDDSALLGSGYPGPSV